jgi:hypothetical protein
VVWHCTRRAGFEASSSTRAAWRRFTKIEIDAVSGGELFPLRGFRPDLATRRMTV